MPPPVDKEIDLSATWMPLEAALIWTATRDPDEANRAVHNLRMFYRRHIPPGSTYKFIATYKYNARIDAINVEGWKVLRKAISQRAVAARGFRVFDGLDRRVPAWERAAEAEALIGPTSLVIANDHGEVVLVDDTHPLTKSTPWKGVMVSQSDLLREFPAEGASLQGGITPQGKGRKEDSVLLALGELSDAHGNLPSMTLEQLFERVVTWLVDHKYPAVSESAFKRGLRRFRDMAVNGRN